MFSVVDWVYSRSRDLQQGLFGQRRAATLSGMSTVKEIKDAIEALPPSERAELERLLREPVRSPAGTPPFPDYAERRRRIFGERVLPNIVLKARESESA